MKRTSRTQSTRRFARALLLAEGGNALVEFGFALPLLVGVSTSGLEMANFMIAKRRVGDIAAQVADNASRLGDGSSLAAKQIREVDINDVFTGGDLQGSNLDFHANGRVILSSLEVNKDNGQWIHWQRCYGVKTHPSSYGSEGAGTTGTSFPGMGSPTARIKASKGNAVMFVEVAYTYKPLMPVSPFNFGTITEIASYTVRNTRDLDVGLVNPAPAAAVSTCPA